MMEILPKDENHTGFQRNCSHGEEGACVVKFYTECAVMGLIAINVIGIGGHLDTGRLMQLLTRPFLVCVAMVIRLTLLPAIGLGISEIFKLGPEASIGTLAVMIAPHEGISSLLLLLLDADLTLSMAICGCVNFTSAAFLPLWAIIYEYRIYGEPGEIKLPVREIFTVFIYITIALSFGYLLRKKIHKCYDKYWEFLPFFTILTIVFIVISELFINYESLYYLSMRVIAASLAIAVTGFLAGAIVAYLLRQTQPVIVVFLMEMGTRTTYVMSVLAPISFPSPNSEMMQIIPLTTSLVTVVPTFILVLFVRVIKTKNLFRAEVSQDEDEVLPMCSATDEPLRKNVIEA